MLLLINGNSRVLIQGKVMSEAAVQLKKKKNLRDKVVTPVICLPLLVRICPSSLEIELRSKNKCC